MLTEAGLRAILDATKDGILAVDNQGLPRFANRSFFKMWSIPEELASGDPLDHRILGRVQAQLVDPAAFRFPVPESRDDALKLLELNGGGFFECRFQAISEDGQPSGWMWSFSDISRQKHTEAMLAERESLLSTILEATGQGFWFIDADGRTADINPAMCRILGRFRDEVLKSSILSFVDSANAEVFQQELEKRKHGKTDPYEITLSRPDGTPVPCINTPTILFDHQGRHIGSVGIWTDISALKSVQQRLNDQLAFQDALFETLPIPVLARNLDGRFVTCNKAYESFFGIIKADLIGKTPFDVFPLGMARAAAETDRSVLSSREVTTDQTTVVRADGAVRRTMIDKACYRNADGDVAGIVATVVDVTEQIQSVIELAAARDEAKAALEVERETIREQRNFLSMVSHEFRTPLAIIDASTQLIDICSNEDGKLEEDLRKIERATRRMSELIDTFLADDRLDSSKWRFTAEEVKLDLLLSDLCRDILDRPLRIVANQPVTMIGDSSLLKIAVFNLLDNALKFSPPGSQIDIHLDTDDEGARISIADRGPGIAPAERFRIFEKFYRSTKSDRVQGVGLGLYIVQRIVELHGGGIAVESPPGGSATFTIWLPLSPSLVPAP